MNHSTCNREDLERLRVPDLKAEAKSRGMSGYSKLRKAGLIDLLTDPRSVVRSDRRKDLVKLCEERNIKYATKMSKQEMIEVLKWNDEDKTIYVHPDTQKRITEYKIKYRDKPERREKAKERSRRW